MEAMTDLYDAAELRTMHRGFHVIRPCIGDCI